ncbi:N-acetylmuramoyl-L-alanine amidase [Streptomyces sp. Babs14]|uniref:N-acetylmuramoyl-L-alanine amidase n=1 Tax=unclassified Streptomyces TaxID=2593676 RepID=UPI001C22E588|nr:MULTISPECIES: N-acetylmuramoyl-L-alanine amidase [unclassified Streptomyces]MBU8549801.1 N-acetylmuramoyl-L-alanine amidase [Streptomyces sp. Osf17]MBU8556584.1 N-acetylmuramoyl-L-alanine amidase [Streptomyces sp. Babs14]
MAAPLSASTFLKALRDEGAKVQEHSGWTTHNRNRQGPWGPMHGVMIHHTVTRGTAATVGIVQRGYSGLPGPLCHGMIAKDGTVHLVGYGRANHAGLGDDDVLRAVIAEAKPPTDNEANTDGNRHFYGFECENMGDGKDPWPAEQIEAIVRVGTAICRAHGWGARSLLRHLDWQPGKIDPRGLDWDDVLARVAKRLGSKPPAVSLPAPKKPIVDLSRLVAAARSNPAASGQPVTYAGVRTVEAALVDEGLLSKTYSDGHFGTTTITAYAAWQRRLGYRGNDADGIPGRTSLERLGDRHGFTVTS